MAKRKLKDLNMIDGKEEKLDNSGEKFVPSTLAQLIDRDDGLWKYSTADFEEYKSQLDDMNTSDLRSHASKQGVLPVTSRERLVKRLLTEFTKHYNQYQKPSSVNVSKKASKAVMDILAEAK